jgi:superfamily II DNA/RNA helicase
LSSFTNFNFDKRILEVLQEIGYDKPTHIQEQAIPKILEGVDVIASAQTGTGKTAAFILPILHLLSDPESKKGRGPQVLILVPTRELAIQVAEEAKKFTKFLTQMKTVCVYGGVPYPIQKRELSRPYDILVATPGRLMDHMNQRLIDLSNIRMLVLDEADRMLDMGFLEEVEKIADATPKDRQTLLFSATIDRKIVPISKKLQNNPFEINVEHDQATENNIEQRLYYVDGRHHKIQILDHILENSDIYQAVIFASTIAQTIELSDYLYEQGYSAEALHGDMTQRERTRAINKMRHAEIQFLVATDVAARGIDIPSITHVINFDLPFQSENFVHRIGRTGRAGAKGVAITFTTYKEDSKLSRIFKHLGKEIDLHTIEGMEPKAKGPNKPNQRRSRPRRGSNFSPSW